MKRHVDSNTSDWGWLDGHIVLRSMLFPSAKITHIRLHKSDKRHIKRIRQMLVSRDSLYLLMFSALSFLDKLVVGSSMAFDFNEILAGNLTSIRALQSQNNTVFPKNMDYYKDPFNVRAKGQLRRQVDDLERSYIATFVCLYQKRDYESMLAHALEFVDCATDPFKPDLQNLFEGIRALNNNKVHSEDPELSMFDEFILSLQAQQCPAQS